jgi:putative adenylate-forming enzyme
MPSFPWLPYAYAVGAFWRTRRLAARLRSRDDVERWQTRRVSDWLAGPVRRVPRYAHSHARALSDLPMVDKAGLMADFSAFNQAGIDCDAAWESIQSGCSPPGYALGASTGTSGNRGLYVISERERFEWLGVMLAKTLARYPFETARIALILPMNSALYSAVGRVPRLDFRFFDLALGLERLTGDVVAYRPDTVIAPPKVLRWLAEHDDRLELKRVFSGAEVLDPVDRSIVERRYGLRIREIYMATEGLLGVACEYGAVHLAEDIIHFELEPVVAGSDLVSPIISDFTRRTQIMARYRMNDLLRLSPSRCRCGSPLRAVEEIVGRRDDIVELPRVLGGACVLITPDILRNVILDADRRIEDFRLEQTGTNKMRLRLPQGLPVDAIGAAVAALSELFERLGASPDLACETVAMMPPADKLRRVKRMIGAASEAR